MVDFHKRDIKLMKYIKSKGSVTSEDITKKFNGDKDYHHRLTRLEKYIKSEFIRKNNKYIPVYLLDPEGISEFDDFLERKRNNRLRIWIPVIISILALLISIGNWLLPKEKIYEWLKRQEIQQEQQEIFQEESSGVSS